MGFLLERFPLPLGAWDGLRYVIVDSLSLPCNKFSIQKYKVYDKH